MHSRAENNTTESGYVRTPEVYQMKCDNRLKCNFLLTECETRTRIANVLACEKSLNETGKCYETVVIEHSFTENCKCQKKTTAFKRLCCAPQAKTIRQCDEEKHEWKISTITFSVVPGDVSKSFDMI